MKYELSHDTLARQVYEKASAEAKALRKVRLLVERALARHRERGVLLTQDDLDEIKPHEKLIRFSGAEAELIRRSRAELERAAVRRRQIALGVMTTLAVFLLFALWQWQRAAENARRQTRMRLAVEARSALYDGRPSLAFRLAEQANFGGSDSAAVRIIREVITDIAASGLIADLEHDARIIAIDFSAEGQSLLTADTLGMLKLWNRAGELQREIASGSPLLRAGFLPWDQQLFTVSTKDSLVVWDGQGKRLWSRILYDENPLASFNAAGSLGVIYGPDEQLSLLDQNGATRQTFPYPNVRHIEFSANGDYILVATDTTVVVVSLKLLELGQFFPKFKINGPVDEAYFVSSDQLQLQTIVIANDTAGVFDIAGQYDVKSYYRFLNEHFAYLPALVDLKFGPPEKKNPKVLFQVSENTLKVWSAYRKNLQGRTRGEADFQYTSTSGILYAGFSADGNQMIVADGDGWVKTYYTGDDPKFNYRFNGTIRDLSFSPQSDLMLTTAGGNTAQLWRFGAPQKEIDWQQVLAPYQQHLRSLTEAEKRKYRLK